jgi:signal transduction histidine kinase
MEDGEPAGFQHIARDVTRERWMQDNLRYYLEQITQAQEEERKRIARELHDDTAQALYGLTRQIDNFVRGNSSLQPGVVAFLSGIENGMRDLLQSVRRFSQDLRPSILDDLGLLPAIRWLLDDLERKHGVKADLRVTGEQRRLSAHAELMLFRVVQEALRNIVRHAQASKVDLLMDFDPGRLRVRVADNGKGFSLSGDLKDLPREGRLGLAGMEERARLIGGKLHIDSKPGEGTAVLVDAPV